MGAAGREEGRAGQTASAPRDSFIFPSVAFVRALIKLDENK